MNSSNSSPLPAAHPEPSFNRREISETALEYLLGEIIHFRFPSKSNDEEAAHNQRLELIGFEVGHRIIAKLCFGHKYIGSDPLDVVKFICKEFWEELFRKKIDKLQTNHRGMFVLTDSRFKWLEKYSSDDIASKQAAAKMLNIPCGLLRGALHNLGITAIVNADFNNLPSCTFNIRVK